MNLGDIRREVPSVDSEFMLGQKILRECEVVFIHPQWRFYTVEFTTDLGWKFRESYYFADKRPDGPPLPEHVRQEREMPNFPGKQRGTRWNKGRGPRFDAYFKPGPIYSN